MTTTDPKLIERIARAIYDATHKHCFDGTPASPDDETWQSYRVEATAILPIIASAIDEAVAAERAGKNAPQPSPDVAGLVASWHGTLDEDAKAALTGRNIVELQEAITTALTTLSARNTLLEAMFTENFAPLTNAAQAARIAALEGERAFNGPLGDDLQFILGQPCFTFIRHAQLWRAAGHTIPHRAEDEQAFFIARMLHHYFTSPDSWHDTWADEIEAVQSAARAAKEPGNG